MEESHNNYLTIHALSTYLGIKPKTLYARVKEIPHYKIGRLIRFRKEDIDAWMEKHRVAKDEKVQEPTTPTTESTPKFTAARARESRKRRGPTTDINRMISKAIDQVKGEGYTASHGKSDQVKGSGKEV